MRLAAVLLIGGGDIGRAIIEDSWLRDDWSVGSVRQTHGGTLNWYLEVSSKLEAEAEEEGRGEGDTKAMR